MIFKLKFINSNFCNKKLNLIFFQLLSIIIFDFYFDNFYKILRFFEKILYKALKFLQFEKSLYNYIINTKFNNRSIFYLKNLILNRVCLS